MDWKSADIRHLVRLALEEDRASEDITTRLLIHPRWRVRAEIRARQRGVVAGLPLAERFFKALDRRCRFQTKVREGAAVKSGRCLAVVTGNARAVLSAERPVLNALQHLCGIATLTYTLVKRLGRGRTRLYDTRKTLPGWRMLEKYAVRCGGGTNHRMSLANGILIKDNHLKVCRLARSPWAKAVKRQMRAQPRLPVEVEIQHSSDLRDVLLLKPQQVLLDNLLLRRLRPMIKTLRRRIPHIQIEISGRVRPSQLRLLARLGVERISMGSITHSAPAFDCSLEITHVDAR